MVSLTLAFFFSFQSFLRPDIFPVWTIFFFLGDVYPALVRFAQNEPLNRTRFNVNVDDTEIEVGPEMGAVENRESKL